MATAAIILGGAIANAIAFTGGQAIYRAAKGGPDPELERKRHDKAVEALNMATVEWNRQRQETLDFINRRLRREGQSQQDFDSVDQALALYNSTHSDYDPTWGRKPTLSDFYQPSESQRQYEYAFIIGSVAVAGVLAYKFL